MKVIKHEVNHNGPIRKSLFRKMDEDVRNMHHILKSRNRSFGGTLLRRAGKIC